MPAEASSPALTRLLDTRGVRFAALIGPDNQVIGSAGSAPPDPALVQAAKAVAESLSVTVGGQGLQDLMMDLSGGPVLLTPQQSNVLVVGFDEVGNLGRVRFAVKREISKL
ncbi:hypothetical protein DKM44_05430 [Deinococcus irradiatisoli]|uniref:Roadblock/LAMTOR2 domain-containing protein n=1 Tax=Deinococcus irradiatisoli TaxID=2202254 RepID=A0A2Z3JIE3_9DEIO|nr:roadblock/LC7 domain-containing protein [Deinococcus irradiatisoli]AWN22739.1 hypothetical protein DKM44_05430 [Deinococcus irradiatisoli]